MEIFSRKKLRRFKASLGFRIVDHVKMVIGRSTPWRFTVMVSFGGSAALCGSWTDGDMQRLMDTEGVGVRSSVVDAIS